MKKLFPGFLFLLFIFGCTKYQSELLKFKSAGGINEINVSAEKTAPMDPLKVAIKVIVPKGEKSFLVELNASKLDSSNVKMVWLSEHTGSLTLLHSDEQTKVMTIDLTGDKIYVIQEVNPQH